jgi:hypothetical protein
MERNRIASLQSGLAFLAISTGLLVAAPTGARTANAPAVNSAAKNVREDRPNLVNFQLVGRGILYSVNFERYFTKWFGVGAGFMAFPSRKGISGAIPVFLNFNPIGDEHSLYVSPGVRFPYGEGDQFNSRAIGTLGVGWQMQLRGGFMMRLGVEILFGDGVLYGYGVAIPLGGITLGGGF